MERTRNEGTGSEDATAKGNVIASVISATDEPAASGNQTTMIIDRIRVVGIDLLLRSLDRIVYIFYIYTILLSRFRIIQSERPYYRILYFSIRLAATVVSLKVIIRRILNEFTTRRVYNAIRRISIKRQLIKARRCNAWRTLYRRNMRYNRRRDAFWLSVIALLILCFWTAERATVVAAPDSRSTIYIVHHKRKTHHPEEIIEIHRNRKRKHKLNIVLIDS